MKQIYLLFILLQSIISAQEINYNVEFDLNPRNQSSLYSPMICPNPVGGFYLVWNSWGGYIAKYSQEIQSTNSIEFHCEFFSNHSACVLDNGSVVVTWFPDDIRFTQVFNSDLIKTTELYSTKMDDRYNSRQASGCTPIDDGFVQVWIDYRSHDKNNIVAQVFNYDLTPRTEPIVVDYSYSNNPGIAVTRLNNGGFVIAWTTTEWDRSYDGIYAQVYDSEYNPVLARFFRINSTTYGVQHSPRLVALDDGGLLAMWRSSTSKPETSGILGKIYNADLSVKRDEFRIIEEDKEPIRKLKVAKVGSNRLVLTWERKHVYNNRYKQDVIGQQIHLDGSKYGEEFVIKSDGEQSLDLAGVCSLDNDKFIVVWKNDISSVLSGKYFLRDYQHHTLVPFNLKEPVTDASIYEYNPKFKWEYASNKHVNFTYEVEYDIYLSHTPDFNESQIIRGIYKTEYRIDSLEAGQVYFWKVLARNYDGDSLWSSNVNGFFIREDAVLDVNKESADQPEKFSLSQNYPNPFNPATTINYALPESAQVTLKVYDILGREVAVLVNEYKQAGTYSVEFNGSGFSSGVYIYQITAGNYSETSKMVLSK